MTSLTSTNREKFQRIVIDCCIQKTEKNSLKKQSLIRLLLAFHSENLVGKFEIHMILLSLYSIYLSSSLHLSEVSGIFDPFQVKMLRNLAYTKE